MTPTQPLTAVRLAGFIWLLLAPLVWLGAALSKMDTAERYNTARPGYSTGGRRYWRSNWRI
jgi:hypothetical protein